MYSLLALFLLILGMFFGCMTILFTIAFHIAHNDQRHDDALRLLILSTLMMALSVTFSIAAGRYS